MFDNNPELDALLKELEIDENEIVRNESADTNSNNEVSFDKVNLDPITINEGQKTVNDFGNYKPTPEELAETDKILNENGIRQIPEDEVQMILAGDKERVIDSKGEVYTGNGDYLLKESHDNVVRMQKEEEERLKREEALKPKVPEVPEPTKEEKFFTHLSDHLGNRIPGSRDETEMNNAEDEFINDYLSFELEMKEMKENFKKLSQEYQLRSVNTRVVTKIVKQIARENKKNHVEISEETRISNRLFKDKNLISKIVGALG